MIWENYLTQNLTESSKSPAEVAKSNKQWVGTRIQMIMPLLHLFPPPWNKKNYPARLFQELTCRHIRACLKNHSRNLHAPLCGIFHPNSVAVARYGALIRAKYPTNCDAHLAESLFQTRSSAKYGKWNWQQFRRYVILIFSMKRHYRFHANICSHSETVSEC